MNIIEKVKLFIKVKKPATDLIKEMKEVKTGWKTIGWWISISATLGTIVTTLAGYLPAEVGLVATVAITALYQSVRAIENTKMVGTAPLLLSTRFWSGIMSALGTALVSLKSGGIDPAWVEAGLTVIGLVTTASQNIGAQIIPENKK